MKKILVMIAMILPLAAMAQNQKENISLTPQQETFQIASELAKYGYSHNDALSLIQAARMSKTGGFQETDRTKESEGGQESSGQKTSTIKLDPAQLLADAKAKANNDEVLLALIEDVQNGSRGAVGGPKYNIDCVRAYGTDYYTVRFEGGRQAIVTVIGDGDTDLDLYIYDQNGNLIDSDTDYTDNCVCTWTPRWTGNFRIKIVNRGSVSNCYVLNTN